MTFQISALPAAQFQNLARLDADTLAARHIKKQVVDTCPGFPCRVTLQDAQIGETVYLLNFTHHDHPTPYQASHAIFVRENAVQAEPAVDEIPVSISSRLLSVRAFNEDHDMINADVLEGIELAAMIETMFSDQAVRYLHLHNAKPGCYAARVDRA